jgi:hypothetical protein
MTFVALDVAADVVLMRTMLGTHNLLLRNLQIQEISH